MDYTDIIAMFKRHITDYDEGLLTDTEVYRKLVSTSYETVELDKAEKKSREYLKDID